MIGRRVLAVVLGGLWVAAVAWGFLRVRAYENAPGHAGRAPTAWPGGPRLGLASTEFTLVLFAHPRCPCTRATLDSLDHLMAHAQGRLTAHVLFWTPPDAGEAWAHTDLWATAAAIPGVQPRCDPGGDEARRFQAETSGQVFLYDRHGGLRFRGGITAARGHAGDSPGCRAILALLSGDTAAPAETPVFGCPLFETPPAPPPSESQA